MAPILPMIYTSIKIPWTLLTGSSFVVATVNFTFGENLLPFIRFIILPGDRSKALDLGLMETLLLGVVLVVPLVLLR